MDNFLPVGPGIHTLCIIVQEVVLIMVIPSGFSGIRLKLSTDLCKFNSFPTVKMPNPLFSLHSLFSRLSGKIVETEASEKGGLSWAGITKKAFIIS